MDPGLRRLNGMSHHDAQAHLLRCCGSAAWASQAARRLPCESRDELHHVADAIWWSLGEPDRLEAFSAHPEIGDRSVESDKSSDGRWSMDEQAGTTGATSDVERRLAEANRMYRERFGFIFIVFATGRRAEEMLRDLESRLENDRAEELRIASEHQMRITELRLDKLLAELEQDA
jgi:OHCU decarboxylase